MSSPMQYVSFGGSGQNTAVSNATPEVLATDQKCRRVMLKAMPANTGIIYVGKSSPTLSASNGWPLSAGEESPWLEVENVNEVYVLASVDGEDVAYVWDQ